MEPVHTVAGITALIRDTLEYRFSGVWVEGEISNLRQPGSGHYYFTLKDPYAQISCVFFKGAVSRCPLRLVDGQKVQIFGSVSVYEARGQYQMVVQTAQRKGDGELQAKFEALKRKLEAEGLFDPARKRPIPRFPRRIGVVTSSTGAAIRDILNVLSRRAPWIQVLIYPTRVQGDGAAEEIAEGVRWFSESTGETRPDLVIVARGGGSIEDLWSFNEEIVARAIVACTLPVMTGVGHEIDFTIADFVADLREPTPSAAAENAVPDHATLERQLEVLGRQLDVRVARMTESIRNQLASLRRELEAREPGRRIQSWMQTLDFLGERMDSLVDRHFQNRQNALTAAGRSLVSIYPERTVARHHEDLARWQERLDRGIEARIKFLRQRMEKVTAMMRSLSPDSVLQRGFSMTTDEEGKILTSETQVREGDRIVTRLAHGSVTSRVGGKA